MTSRAPLTSWTLSTRSRREMARSRRTGRPNPRRGQRSSLGRRISCTSALRRQSRSVLLVVGQRRSVHGQALGRHPLGFEQLAVATPPTGAWLMGPGASAPNCSSHSLVQAQGVQTELAPLSNIALLLTGAAEVRCNRLLGYTIVSTFPSRFMIRSSTSSVGYFALTCFRSSVSFSV